MSTDVEGGRPLLRFRLLGFPVHVDVSFVVIIGLLGWLSRVTVSRLPIWIAVATVAVLVHELGHAVTARWAGARPAIALAGFGGVTTFSPPRPLSRLASLGISLAGPGIGLAAGALLLVVARNVAIEPDWVRDALAYGIWTTIGWSLFNLVPILPLDGGQALRELLPGSPEVRARRAALASVRTLHPHWPSRRGHPD